MTTPQPDVPLKVEGLKVFFRVRRAFGKARSIKAVDDVSFELASGETLGIAGESGSGKSSVARSLVQLTRPTGGTISLAGAPVTNLKGQRLKRFRRRMQMVYQDPYDSLDPRMAVSDAIGEALSVRGLPRAEHAAEVIRLLERVKLPASAAERFPNQLSGGQRQR